MSRDRRRGKRRYQGGSRPGVGRQPAAAPPQTPAQKASNAEGTPLPSRPEPSQRAPAPARTMPRPGAPSRQLLLGNPHLGKDLRLIGIVTAVLLVLLIVLWLVL